jgi:hypothetical protein
MSSPGDSRIDSTNCADGVVCDVHLAESDDDSNPSHRIQLSITPSPPPTGVDGRDEKGTDAGPSTAVGAPTAVVPGVARAEEAAPLRVGSNAPAVFLPRLLSPEEPQLPLLWTSFYEMEPFLENREYLVLPFFSSRP